MPRYLFVEHQEGGCDYTIGCGTRLTDIDAPNPESARLKFWNEYLGGDDLEDWSFNPLDSENAPDSVKMYEIACEFEDAGYESTKAKWQAIIDEDADKQKEQEEREEYKRLKDKYG